MVLKKKERERKLYIYIYKVQVCAEENLRTWMVFLKKLIIYIYIYKSASVRGRKP